MKKKRIAKLVLLGLSLWGIMHSEIKFNNQSDKAFDLTLSNISAMASSSEGPVTDPNIALHSYLEGREDKNGRIIAMCCKMRYYDDRCNYRSQWGDCRGVW